MACPRTVGVPVGVNNTMLPYDSSVASLIQLLNFSKQSYGDFSRINDIYVIENWISNNGNVNELISDTNLATAYSYFTDIFSYICCSETFSNCLKDKVTCQLICSIATVAKSYDAKLFIICIYASSCIDKNNAKDTFTSLLNDADLNWVLQFYK